MKILFRKCKEKHLEIVFVKDSILDAIVFRPWVILSKPKLLLEIAWLNLLIKLIKVKRGEK